MRIVVNLLFIFICERPTRPMATIVCIVVSKFQIIAFPHVPWSRSHFYFETNAIVRRIRWFTQCQLNRINFQWRCHVAHNGHCPYHISIQLFLIDTCIPCPEIPRVIIPTWITLRNNSKKLFLLFDCPRFHIWMDKSIRESVSYTDTLSLCCDLCGEWSLFIIHWLPNSSELLHKHHIDTFHRWINPL